MIVRIVKLTFREDAVPDFLRLFEEVKSRIRTFEGCTRLELLRVSGHPHVFFTYSIWQSEAHLEKYRDSGLFAETWETTKSFFAARPEAWTCTTETSVTSC